MQLPWGEGHRRDSTRVGTDTGKPPSNELSALLICSQLHISRMQREEREGTTPDPSHLPAHFLPAFPRLLTVHLTEGAVLGFTSPNLTSKRGNLYLKL